MDSVIWMQKMVQGHAVLAVTGLAALSLITVVLYRLTLHPLARVPGPVLAAATGAYEAYFQLIKDRGGRYWVEIDRLHDLYGACVQHCSREPHLTRPCCGYFNKDFNEAIKSYSRIGILNRHLFGLPHWLLQSLPASITNKISSRAGQSFVATVNRFARYAFDNPVVPEEGPQDAVQTMLAADLPKQQKTFDRVFGECRSFILAGTETTATVLTSITYHALANPDILTRLRTEIRSAFEAKGAALEYQEVKALPYLTGVINEALRTSNSISARLVRYSDAVDLQYQQFFLPHGTYISVSMNDLHMNSVIFPEPERFNPDRWLNQADYKRLVKHLQPWGRGSRLCLGLDLAYTDVYLTVSRLFGPQCSFQMQLFKTKQSDWDVFHDYFGPAPGPGSRGLRVLVEPS
ncbi:hypothetical protein MY5147_000787 [Beauveria neobassiana]